MPYHVRLSAGFLGLRTKELFNLDRKTLVSEIVEPWTRGTPILLNGQQWQPDSTKVSVYEGAALTSQQRSMWQGWTKAMEFGEDVTNEVLTDEFREQTRSQATLLTTLDQGSLGVQHARHKDWDASNVAVFYGADGAARDAMFDFLRALGLNPLEWSVLVAATSQGTPPTFDVVKQAFSLSQAVVVLFTPDDVARLHRSLWRTGEDEALQGQPRQNVLIEAGMAMALNPNRTVIVEIGRLRRITNLDGLNTVRIDGASESLNNLATRLESAGCPVRRNRTDWLNSARFSALQALARKAETIDRIEADEPAPTSSFPGIDEDDLAEVAAAARRAGLPDDARRDLVIVNFLRQCVEPFQGGDLAKALPAPRLLGEEIKRLLAELRHTGLLDRNEDERRGWISTHAGLR